MDRKRCLAPVDYAESKRIRHNAAITVKLEKIDRMQTAIVRLNKELYQYGPVELSEEDVNESIGILVRAGDDSRRNRIDDDDDIEIISQQNNNEAASTSNPKNSNDKDVVPHASQMVPSTSGAIKKPLPKKANRCISNKENVHKASISSLSRGKISK